MATKSLPSPRNTEHFTTLAMLAPQPSRIRFTLLSTTRVSWRMSPNDIWLVAGSFGPWPETKIKPPARTAGEYGDFGTGTPGGMILSIILYFTLMAFRFEEALRFHRRHATGPGGRDRLPAAAVLHVAGMEDSGDVGPGAAFGQDIAVGVRLDLALEYGGVGNVSDSHEKSFHLLLPDRARLQVVQLHPADEVGGDVVNLLHHGIGKELDLGIAARAVKHDFRRAKLIAAVHQRHLRAEAGEEIGLLHGGIAAADDHDLAAAIEESVAGGAGADAVADQLLLRGQAQPARRCARGDDQSAGLHPLALDMEPERPLGEIRFMQRAMQEFGAEILRLLLDVFHQIGSKNPVRKAGEVFDQRGER